MRDGVCFEKENVVANDTKSATTWICFIEKAADKCQRLFLERATRLELATSTLARWRSTG